MYTLLLLATSAFATTLDREPISPLAFPNRVCNDGSIPIFYISLAPSGSDNADKWLLDFDGDGEPCADAAECAANLPDHYSTMGTGCTADAAGNVTCDQNVGAWSVTAAAPWPVTRDLEGIFADGTGANANPGFADWNKVQIVSCSSDLWSGDGGTVTVPVALGGFPTLDGSSTVTFAGSEIAGAVFFTLVTDYQLLDANVFVLAGSGTGASGVYNHLDRAEELLNAYAGHPIVVKGIVDSAATRILTDEWDSTTLNDDPAAPGTDYGCRARLSSGVLPDLTWYDTAVGNWDGWGLDQSCVSHLPSGAGSGRCLYPEYLAVLDEVTTPFFFRQDFADEDGILAMDDALSGAPGHADGEACFIQTQHNRGLGAQRASALGGYFMPCDGDHAGLTEDGPFATTTANGHTLSELLDNFVNGTAPNTRAAEAGCLVYPDAVP